MTAELERVTDPRDRWAFATGCARTAVLPPPGDGIPVAAVALLSTGAAAGAALLVGRTIPGLHTFTVTFAVIVAAMATLAAARSRHPLRRPSPATAVVGLAGVAAGVAVTARFLARHPAAGDALSELGVVLAVVLAGCLWLTTAPPRGLTTSRLARVLGLVTAVALVAGLVLAIRLPSDSGGVLGYVVTAPVPVLFLLGALTAGWTRSLRAGVQAVVWTLVPAMLLAFAAWVVEGERWYERAGGQLMLDNDAGPVGATVGDAVVFALLVAPIWAFPFGVLGAAVGSRRHRRHGTHRLGVTVHTQPG